MRRILPPLWAASLLFLAWTAPAAPPDREALLEAGTSALAAGHYSNALPPLLAARRIDTNEPGVHIALGAALLNARRIPEARVDFEDASGLCVPASAEARLAQAGAAICLLTEGEFQLAAERLQKYLGTDPAADVPRACLSYALLKLGNAQQAATQAARVKADPEVAAFALYVYGAALFEAGAHSEAAGALSEALARCPGPIYEPYDSALVIRPDPARWKGRSVMQANVLTPPGGELSVEPEAPPAGTQSVAFYLDGAMRQASNQGPFRFRVDGSLPPGLHTASLEAYGADGALLASAAARLHIPGVAEAPDPERLPSAIEGLGSLLRPLPDRAALHCALGRALERANRLEEARNEYEACFAVRADEPGVMSRLAQVYRRLHVPTSPKRDIWRAPRKKPPLVALTFDDGPHPVFTPKLLDMLRERRIKATFFPVGSQVLAYPHLTRQMAADGHEIGNHTFTHPNLTFLTPTAIQQEILRTKLALRKVAGRQSLLFRPPGGRYGEKEKKAVAALGYRTVLWTSNIAAGKAAGAEAIAVRMARELNAGGIALMHNGRDETLQVLPLLIDRLKRRHVRFVTISQLLGASEGKR
jgi:peptidoglycan/xylan/chitin deacetylase (PgdA/CDA1 family)/Flp pilus assembly protein TadD